MGLAAGRGRLGLAGAGCKMSDAGPFPQTTSAPRLPKPELLPPITTPAPAPSSPRHGAGTRAGTGLGPRGWDLLRSGRASQSVPSMGWGARGVPKSRGDVGACSHPGTSPSDPKRRGPHGAAPNCRVTPGGHRGDAGGTPFASERTPHGCKTPQFLSKSPEGFCSPTSQGEKPTPGAGTGPKRLGNGAPHPSTARAVPGSHWGGFGAGAAVPTPAARGTGEAQRGHCPRPGNRFSSFPATFSPRSPPRSTGLRPGRDGRNGEERNGEARAGVTGRGGREI